MNALALSEARAIHLSDCFNFTLWEPVLTVAPPAILAGRHPYMDVIARQIRKQWNHAIDVQPKFWLPSIGGFLPISRKETIDPVFRFAYFLRRIINELKFRLSR